MCGWGLMARADIPAPQIGDFGVDEAFYDPFW